MTINLCFHGIGTPQRVTEPGEDPYWISIDLFHTVLDLLAQRPDVELSFDDGNHSDVAVALPALTERNLRATFFALAGRLDQPGSLRAADLRTLMASGMKIGSHGMNHIPWRGLSLVQQNEEFSEARNRLSEEVGAPVLEAALPLGRYDRQVLRSLRSLGYAAVYTSDRLPARGQSQWLRPRYSIQSTDTMGSVQRILAGPSWRDAARTQAKMVLKAARPGVR